MVKAYDLPHLTVIYNNSGWRAVSDAIEDQYSDIEFDRATFTRFDSGTDYAAFADGLGCYGEQVSSPRELESAIERGLAAVEERTHATLDVAVHWYTPSKRAILAVSPRDTHQHRETTSVYVEYVI